jgi:hypothetical protein
MLSRYDGWRRACRVYQDTRCIERDILNFAGFCRVSGCTAAAILSKQERRQMQEDRNVRGLGRDAAASHPDG